MNMLLVYVGTFIGASIIDALWHVVLFGSMYRVLTPPLLVPEILSRILFVTALVFMVLYKTGGHPKMRESTMIGAVVGILAISIYGLTNFALHTWSLELALLEVVWGPIAGALYGVVIAFLSKKLL